MPSPIRNAADAFDLSDQTARFAEVLYMVTQDYGFSEKVEDELLQYAVLYLAAQEHGYDLSLTNYSYDLKNNATELIVTIRLVKNELGLEIGHRTPQAWVDLLLTQLNEKYNANIKEKARHEAIRRLDTADTTHTPVAEAAGAVYLAVEDRRRVTQDQIADIAGIDQKTVSVTANALRR